MSFKLMVDIKADEGCVLPEVINSVSTDLKGRAQAYVTSGLGSSPAQAAPSKEQPWALPPFGMQLCTKQSFRKPSRLPWP